MKKIFCLCVVLIGMISTTLAQLQVGTTINPWYHKVPQVHNMALISMTAVPTANFMAGTRMGAFDNNPTNVTALASGFITDAVAIGMKINSEKAGLSSNLDAQLAFVYRVYLNKEKGDKLSFFLAGHFAQDQFMRDNAILLDPNDPALLNTSMLQPSGNASSGFAFFRENLYYVGLSAYNLIPTKTSYMNTHWENKTLPAFYFLGSYNFLLSDRLALELSTTGIYQHSQYVYEADINAKWNKIFWIGTGYSSNSSIKGNFGVSAQSWTFGLLSSYGGMTDVAKYTYKGLSHSIFVRKIFNEGRRQKE